MAGHAIFLPRAIRKSAQEGRSGYEGSRMVDAHTSRSLDVNEFKQRISNMNIESLLWSESLILVTRSRP